MLEINNKRYLLTDFMIDVTGHGRIRRVCHIILGSSIIIIAIRTRSIDPVNLSRSIHRTIEYKTISMSHDIWKRNCKKKENIIQSIAINVKRFI